VFYYHAAAAAAAADDDDDDAGGADVLTFYDGLRYRLATAFTLAYPYGFTRIMSSYHWDGGPYRSVQWFSYVVHYVAKIIWQ